MSSRRLHVLALSVPAMLLVASCGDSPSFDAESVESFLVSSQSSAFGADAEVGEAKCPDDVALKEHLKVQCTLEVSGTSVPYDVELTQVTDDPVHVEAHLDGVVVPTKAILDYLVSTLPKTAKGTQIDCGSGDYLVAKVDDTFDCDLSLGAQVKTVTLQVDDDGGTISVVG